MIEIASPVADFLRVIRGAYNSTATVPVWNRKAGRSTSVGYPCDVARLKSEDAQFYGTASMRPTLMGDIRNRQSQFESLHVVVLDDIGTKVPVASLPDALANRASYILESSPGNYQYGYVLEEPLADLAAAKVLIQTVYRSGFTDGGGGLVNKAVRLPFGVNGKAGPNQDFPVNLIRCTAEVWSPAQLFEAIGSTLIWADVLSDPKGAARAGATPAASAWSPVPLHGESAAGYVDPVLEWLIEQELVLEDGEEWSSIVCPWADDHSDGEPSAGYNPVGRGEGENQNTRGFHCFHDHCKDHGAPEFLAWVAAEGGPEASGHDTAWRLVAAWAFDAPSNAAQHLTKNLSVPIAAFRNLHPQKVRVPTFEKPGKTHKISEVDIWINSPNRVTLHGMVYKPGDPNRIIFSDGAQRLNTFDAPSWGAPTVNYDANVRRFTNFIAYLIPDATERHYFTDWLAAKSQNYTFRGAGIVMTTPAFGVGRGTLARIVTELFTSHNVASMGFDKLVGANVFNEWQEKLFLICDETRDQGEGSLYKAYERLKDLIDVHVKDITINPKYERPRQAQCCTSFMLFSNHADGVAIAEGDRRLYVITNPATPQSPQAFETLNAWLDNDAWQADVWAFLKTHTPDMALLLAPAPATEAKKGMIEAGKSSEQKIAEYLINASLESCGCWIPNLMAPLLESISASMGKPARLLRTQVRRVKDVTAFVQERRVYRGTKRLWVHPRVGAALDLAEFDWNAYDAAAAMVAEDVADFIKCEVL